MPRTSFKRTLQTLSLGEAVASVGVIITVLGQAFKITDSPALEKAANGVSIVGLALFMAGIVITLRQILEALKDQREEHEILNTARSIAETGSWRVNDPKSIYVRATSQVLKYIVAHYVPHMAKSLEAFKADPSLNIVVEDQSPIFDLMWRLGKSLPKGGAWLGITLLEDENAWTNPLDDKFIEFRNLMRVRASRGKLRVLRLYYFKSSATYENLRQEMNDEHQSGIIVRYLIGGRAPPDLSMLWIPPKGVHRLLAVKDLSTDSPVDAVRSGNWQPLCALAYDTRSGALLTKLSIHAGDSIKFDKLNDYFGEYWRKATRYPD